MEGAALYLQALGGSGLSAKNLKKHTTDIFLHENYREDRMRSVARRDPRKQKEKKLLGC
jgi:hypothetical protein